MNTNIILNLQYALKQNGFIVTVQGRQLYNAENDVFVRFHQVKHNNKNIYSSTSKILIVKFLGYLYQSSKEYINQKAHPQSIDDFMKLKIASYLEEEKLNDKKKKEA